jgi:hypothetical protein
MLHGRLLYRLEGRRTDRQKLTLAQRDNVPVPPYFALKANTYPLCVLYWCNAGIRSPGTGQQPYNSAQYRFTADVCVLQEIKIKLILAPALLGFLTNNYLSLSEQTHLHVSFDFFFHSSDYESRSQWPRGLRHEPSSSARTLGSWVRILLEAWMFVCVYSVFVLFCV